MVIHTQRVIDINSKLLSSLKDAETGERGFLLTGKPKFLEPYFAGKSNYTKHLNEIKLLTRDNHLQQVRIDSISKMILSRIAILDTDINIKSKAGDGYISSFSTLENGKKTMDSIRILSKSINDEEQMLLKKRQKISYDNARQIQKLFYSSLFITLSLFVIICYSLIRQIAKTTKVKNELYNYSEWFKQTLVSLGDGVVATSPDHKITYMNRAAEKLTLYKSEEAISLPIETVINIRNEYTGEPVIVPTIKAIEKNCVVELENHTVLTRKDGSEFFIDDSAAPVYDIENTLLGAVLVFRDVTEKSLASKKLLRLNEELEEMVSERTLALKKEIVVRLKAEEEKTKLIEQLIEINKSLEQFIYIVSHNFRRPVANIIGLISLIDVKDSGPDNESTLNYLLNEINHLDIVLKDLGTLTTIRKNLSENKEPVSLLPLLLPIIESMEYEINKTDADIKINIAPDSTVFGIKSYLNSILLNLINNAIKYKKPERKLNITLDFNSTDTHDIIIVRDNGLGIDLEKYREKIFGLYNRFHPQVEGKGLGLHISKTQIEMMGGSIEVKSHPDAGAEFYLNLPKAV